jgi:hypothetical protein
MPAYVSIVRSDGSQHQHQLWIWQQQQQQCGQLAGRAEQHAAQQRDGKEQCALQRWPVHKQEWRKLLRFDSWSSGNGAE